MEHKGYPKITNIQVALASPRGRGGGHQYPLSGAQRSCPRLPLIRFHFVLQGTEVFTISRDLTLVAHTQEILMRSA